MERFEQSVPDILDQLKVSRRNDPRANVFQLLRIWLWDAIRGDWLIVSDNADDVRFLLEPLTTTRRADDHSQHAVSAKRCFDYIPACEHGSVWVTTKSQSADLSLVGQSHIVNVEPTEEEHVLKLLEEKTLGHLYD